MAAPPPPLLLPWYETLRTLRVRPARDADDGDATALSPSPPETPTRLWVHWTFLTHAPPPLTARALEAVELFVLLAWADPFVWKCAVRELCDGQSPVFGRPWTTIELLDVTVVGHEVVCTEEQGTSALYDYLAAREDALAGLISQEYRDVRTTLETLMARSTAIPVRLRLSPHVLRSTVREALPAVLALGKLQQALQELDPMQSQCRLAMLRSRVCEVHDDMRWLTRVDEAMLRLMVEVWTTGILVVDLASLAFPLGPANSCFYVSALHTLLGIGQEGCVRCVTIGQPSTPPLKHTLLSALAYSPSVRSVHVMFDEGEASESERLYLQCMAYGLLSSSAQNELRKISVSCLSLTTAKLDMMRPILFGAEDPLVKMYPEYGHGVVAHQDVQLTASALRLNDPLGAEAPIQPAGNVVLEALRVLAHDVEWWTVLLPGWGLAWVHDTHALVTERPRVDPPITNRLRAINELVITGASRGNDAVMVELLQTVGAGIKTLRLCDAHRNVDRWCRDVLLACPKLEAIELCQMDSGHFPIIVDSFRDGLCAQLKELKLTIEYVPETALQELTELLDALANKVHPIATTLQTLEVYTNLSADFGNPFQSDIHDVALRMLQTNTTLARLALDVPVIVTDRRRLEAGFAEQHNVLLPTSLTDREKAAFMSVMSRAAASSASAQFDCQILSSIFSLAPERTFRQVEVTLRHQ